jgi:hypothetical protein
MKVHDLHTSQIEHQSKVKRVKCTTNLIPALVPHQDYEGSMIFLNIVVNEDWYPRVQLFAHRSGASRTAGEM